MRLTPVVGLVIEEVRERRRKALRHCPHVGDRHVDEAPGERLVGQPPDPVGNPSVLQFTRLQQSRVVGVQDRVERRRRLTLAGEPLQPDPVRDEDVVERAAERLEVGSCLLVERLGRQLARRRVERGVGPRIIGRKLLKCCFMDFPPGS